MRSCDYEEGTPEKSGCTLPPKSRSQGNAEQLSAGVLHDRGEVTAPDSSHRVRLPATRAERARDLVGDYKTAFL